MRECGIRSCKRPLEGSDPEGLCRLHEAIWKADNDGCEASVAASELLPAMIQLAAASCNEYLEDALKNLRVQALDYSERCYLEYAMLYVEDDMNLD